MYEKTDEVIALLNKDAQRQFSRFQNALPVDELNVLNGAKKLFKRLEKKAVLWYNIIGRFYYDHFDGDPKFWTDDIVTDYLEETDPVTKYVYRNEIKRKRDRMAEAILADRKNAAAEIRKARRLWMLQTDRYAVAISDIGQIKAYRSRGVKYVRWKTNIDGRECETCYKRNGKIYAIDRIPPKPHYGCRCSLTAASREDYDRQKKSS